MGLDTTYEVSGQAPVHNREAELQDRGVTASISSASKSVENGNLTARTIEGRRRGNFGYAPSSHLEYCFEPLPAGLKKVQGYHRSMVSACWESFLTGFGDQWSGS
jgi:hypothetical protein